MATNTYVALDKITVGTAVSSITLSSINQGYTDLVLVVNAASSSAASCRIRFNADTGTNYSDTRLYGDGSSATSDRLTNRDHINCGDLSVTSITSNQIINIMNYSNATTYKTVLTRSNIASSYVFANVSLWRATPAAITSITVFPASGNFVAGSTFSLYGIAADTNSTTKATGGVISSDANYWYHTFAMSGTFTPLQSLTCDYMIVAGGGGGGGGTFANANGGGGGGAGGLRTFTSQAFSATAYTVTVGAGGAAGNTSTGVGGSGSTTTFFSTSATGGGGGGSEAITNNGGGGKGSSGGSGGGSSGSTSTVAATGNAGGYTPVEGYAGASWVAGVASGSGGGGAGAAGSVASNNSVGGPGGTGATSTLINAMAAATNTGQLSSGNYYYAGGGGGATYENSGDTTNIGGKGGGGKGNAYRSFPGDGTAGIGSTGSGGGGGNSGGTAREGYNGGSGIVIVRYAK